LVIVLKVPNGTRGKLKLYLKTCRYFSGGYLVGAAEAMTPPRRRFAAMARPDRHSLHQQLL
jgi:hypothetical protein